MFSSSKIDPHTIQAYLETEYRVDGEEEYALRIGQFSSHLLAAHERFRVSCSAFLTACNPYSQALDAASNEARQAALAEVLSEYGLAYLQGIGQHPSNGWSGEESFLIFGLSLESAKLLGMKFEQNGFVWSGENAVPQLILLK